MMRWFAVSPVAALLGLIVACGGGSDEGGFIDSTPIRGGVEVLRTFPGDGSLADIVGASDALVVAEVIEVVGVEYSGPYDVPELIPTAIAESWSRGVPYTTYRLGVDQWLKGDGAQEIMITDIGGITPDGPLFLDGDFLLEPGRKYVMTLQPNPGMPGGGDYSRRAVSRGTFEVTDGFVHVLNHPIPQDLQEQYGGMPLAQFVDVLRDYAARPPLPPPTLVPPPSPQPQEVGLNVIESGSPMAGIIDTVAVDTAIKSNTATSLGGRKACSALARGGTLTIDVTANAIAAPREGKGGIAAFSFVLVYDPNVVKVLASDHAMLLAANPGSYLVSLSNETPDADGRFLVAVADLGNLTVPQHDSGVLARITLEGVGPGVSDLTLDSVIIGDHFAEPYAIENVLAAHVAVDAPCSP